MKAKNITKEYFIETCNNSQSMTQAAIKLGLHFNTFKKYAIEYECYKTNQSGKGIKKNIGSRVNFNEIKTRAGVRKRILKENTIENKCNECGILEWQGQKLSLHLDHINGDRWDHRIENLRFLCPNCHSLTETYTGKNK